MFKKVDPVKFRFERKAADVSAAAVTSGFDLESLSTECLVQLTNYAEAFGQAGGRFVIRGQYSVTHHTDKTLVIDPNVTVYKLKDVGPMAAALLKTRLEGLEGGEAVPTYVFGKGVPPEGWTARFTVTKDDTQKELAEAIRQWQQADAYDYKRKYNDKVLGTARHVVVTGAAAAGETKKKTDEEAALDEILESPAAALADYLAHKGKPKSV